VFDALSEKVSCRMRMGVTEGCLKRVQAFQERKVSPTKEEAYGRLLRLQTARA
jgi:hypothetical protein